ncbi:MAG: hypothetical protein ACK55I_01665, partial [bacterium]
MPVGEADARGPVVVAGRVVDDPGRSGTFHHLVGVAAGIDAVGMLVQQHVHLRGAHGGDVRGLLEDAVALLAVLVARSRGQPAARAAHRLAHAHAPHPGVFPAPEAHHAQVRRAFV